MRPNDKLLSECRVETMRASGKGGQHVNRTDSAVKLTHIPTGLTVKVQESPSQHRNKAIALELLKRKIETYRRVKKPRKKTKKPASVKEKDLQTKKKHSVLKKNRKKVSKEEL
jgi:protein subunit release factor A